MSFNDPESSLSTECLARMSDCDRTYADEIDACLAALEVAAGDLQPGTAVAALTDNSGGATGNDTIAAIPDPTDTPASADALRDDLVATVLPKVRDAVADLAAKVNAIRTVLVAAGILS